MTDHEAAANEMWDVIELYVTKAIAVQLAPLRERLAILESRLADAPIGAGREHPARLGGRALGDGTPAKRASKSGNVHA